MAEPLARDLRGRLDTRYTSLRTERSHFEHDWRLAIRHVAPHRGQLNPTDRTSDRSVSKRRNIINNVGSRALRDLAAGLATNVINPATPWFRLSPQDDDLEEYGKVREWLDKVEKRAYGILADGGFYGAATVALYELAAFGTACLAEEASYQTVRRWSPWTVGEYYLANGVDGRASSVYREWQMTVESMVATFGADRCSLAVRQAWNAGKLDHKFTVRHAIEPNSERFASRPGLARWKYVNLYWDPAEPDREKYLRLGGNSYCPVHAVRWLHVPPNAYGHGPISDALGDIASLQLAERDMVVGIGHKTNPAIQGPPANMAGGVSNPTRFERGQFYPTTAQAVYGPVIDPRSFQLQDADLYIQRLEDRITKTCFNDLFRMFLQRDRSSPLTATETIERAKEKQLIGPVLHNINSELLQPVVDGIMQTIFEESRPFWSRGEPGMVPVPPPEIQDADLKIDFVGELQQSQRLVRAEPIYRLAAFAGEFAQIDPTLPMKLDLHQAVDELGGAWGVPPRVVRDDETVAAMMDEQAKAQAAQQQQQQQLQAAEVASKLGSASTEPGTALGDLAAEAA